MNHTNSILLEHNKVVKAKHFSAIFNYILILASTLVTLIFMLRKGASDGLMTHIYILVAINVIQIVVSITDYVTTVKMGVYVKALFWVTWAVGGLWALVWIGAFTVGSLELGSMRIDLLIIAAIQFMTAITTSVIWFALDRKALDSMIKKNVRDDEEARMNKANKSVRTFVVLSVVLLIVQCGSLIAYKVPPTVYDLFSDTRALQYELNKEETGYIVTGTCLGTSQTVNVPATYNNKPVIGIKEGGIKDIGISGKNKITNLTLGTPVKKEDGTVEYVSNLTYIETAGISCDNIKELTLPVSIKTLGTNAIKSESLENIRYECKSNFAISYLQCSSLSKIVMAGSSVGNIRSLEGMSKNVSIEVSKDIYNEYREVNTEFMQNFLPSIEDNEIFINFYTNCDYYINSIFGSKSEGIAIGYRDLRNNIAGGAGMVVDTLAYIKDKKELGTNGIKGNSAFRGWYFDPEFKDECVFNELTENRFTESVSLYAKWIDEYVVNYDWGTYKPDNVITSEYWTKEDNKEFPVVDDRLGYEGIDWKKTLSGKTIYDTTELNGDITLKGVWQLTKPTIDVNIDSDFSGGDFNVSLDKDRVTFVYDEKRVLEVSASNHHILEGLSYKGQTWYYTYLWNKKNSEDNISTLRNLSVQNVAEADIYTLTVTAHSPYGDVSFATSDIEIVINKKPLDIGNVKLNSNENYVYDGMRKSILHEGTVSSDLNVIVKYAYYNENGEIAGNNEGVVNAGNYRVEATFMKNNDIEFSNYETKVLTANCVIKPKNITVKGWKGVGWMGDAVAYNGEERTIELEFEGKIGNELVDLVYENNAKTDADTYVAQVVGINNSNYSLTGVSPTSLTKEWSISPKAVEVSKWNLDSIGSSSTCIYDGKQHIASAVLSGKCEGDSVDFKYSTEESNIRMATNSGDYTAKIIGVNNPNYTFNVEADNATYNWSIQKRSIMLSNIPPVLEYDGKSKSMMISVSNLVEEDVTLLSKSDFDFTGTHGSVGIDTEVVDNELKLLFSAVDAHTYEVVFNGLNAGEIISNYTITKKNYSLIIKPKNINFRVDNNEKLTYNGYEQENIVLVEGIVEKDLKEISAKDFTSESAISKGDVDGETYRLYFRAKDAGAYTYSITSFNNSNYTISTTSNDLKFTIAKKELSINKWQVEEANSNNRKDYTSDSQLTYNSYGYTVSPVVIGVVEGETVDLELTAATQSNAGTKSTTASLDAEEYGNYKMDTVVFNWVINKYAVDVNWIPNTSFASGTSFVYDGIEKTIIPTFSTLRDEDPNIAYSANNRIATDVGTYSIIASGFSNSNYMFRDEGDKIFNWSITPKAVYVEWENVNNYTYNGTYQAPSFKITGLLDKDISSTLYKVDCTGDLRYSVNISAMNGHTQAINSLTVNAGSYDVTVSAVLKGAQVNTNYEIKDSRNKAYTINKKQLILSDWYYSNSKKGNSPVVYNEGQDLIYNTATYTLTKNFEGVVNHLNQPASVNLAYENNSLNSVTDIVTAKVIGITGAQANNYTIENIGNHKAEWQITPKIINVSWVVNNYTYNNQNFVQSASVTSGATADDDMKAYSSVALEYKENIKRDAGSYQATVSSANANYRVSEETQAYNWQIKQKAANFSWEYSSVTYNGEVQYPRASVYCNGETVYANTYTGFNNTIVGGYTVTATGLATSNYTMENASNVSRTYSITQRQIELSWVDSAGVYYSSGKSYIYDGKTKTIAPRVTNLIEGDALTLEYSRPVIKNTGSYEMVVTSVSNENYKLNSTASNNKFTIQINKKTLEFDWSAGGEYTYNGDTRSIVAVANNLCSGDSVALSYTYTLNGQSTTAANIKNAGTYNITVSGISGDSMENYALPSQTSLKTQSITIVPKAVSLNWGTTTFVYNGEDRSLNATPVGILSSDSGVTVNYSNNQRKSVGETTVTATSLSNKNYTISNNKQVLTITPKEVRLDWGITEFTYDGQIKSLKATPVGILNADGNVTVSYSNNGRTDAGRHTVTAIGLSNSNYTIINNTAVIIVKEAVLEFVWNGESTYPYNGKPYKITATPSLYAGDTINLMYRITDSKGNNVDNIVDVGVYTIEIIITDNQNYTLAGSKSKSRTVEITAVEEEQKL